MPGFFELGYYGLPKRDDSGRNPWWDDWSRVSWHGRQSPAGGQRTKKSRRIMARSSRRRNR